MGVACSHSPAPGIAKYVFVAIRISNAGIFLKISTCVDVLLSNT